MQSIALNKFGEEITFVDAWQEIFRLLAKYPSLRKFLEPAVMDQSVTSIQKALEWLQDFERKYLRLNYGFLTVESHDMSIENAAREISQKFERSLAELTTEAKRFGRRGRWVKEQALMRIKAAVAGMEVTLPVIPEDLDSDRLAGTLARLIEEHWWRRQIRKLINRKFETANRLLGSICKKYGGYCSDQTLKRRQARRKANMELLKKMEAVNELDEHFLLSDIWAKSVSNPENRRAELMTRIRGFEEFAKQVFGWEAVFITQTCPSRFHSHHKGGNRYGNWNESTPRDAQLYLREVWARVRSKWARSGIACFGFRVAEPHHEGCPHWHLLLWFPKTQVKDALDIYRSYALADSPSENGAQKRRFTVKTDEVAGSATGYIAKYISKNVDGLKDDGTAWDPKVVQTALRTEAWASTWGIRQFQQIGGPSVMVYRELRKLTEKDLGLDKRALSEPEKDRIAAIRKAADDGDWKLFVDLMGGPVCPRKERPLQAHMVDKTDDEGKPLKNKYYEVIRQFIGVLAFQFEEVKTRLHEWTIRPLREAVESFEEAHAPPLDLCQ